MATYKVKPCQNIFDISIQLYGTIEGVFDLLISNKSLSMNTDLKADEELEYHEDFVLNEPVVSRLKKEGITPANGERHVYYKGIPSSLIAVCKVDSSLPSSELTVGGEGILVVDWGDNSDLEYIVLSAESQHVVHYFDNEVTERCIKLYGDTLTLTFHHLETSNIGGSLFVTLPITVEEYISRSNGCDLSGLFLFEGTYRVDLQGSVIADLSPVADMNLEELDLRNASFNSASVIDAYLLHVLKNYGTRMACTVLLDTAPSEIGWAAIGKILEEDEWNSPTPWKFIIKGTEYTY